MATADEGKRPGKRCGGESFKALMLTQGLGALNDNVFKVVLSLMIVSGAAEKESLLLSLAQALFVLPFIFLSSIAGYFADRFSKTQVIRAAKGAEVAVALLALYFFSTENLYMLLLLLFAMGVHSAGFSPAKYGILPELLDDDELSRGNGYLEFWTFVAIIGGTALAGILRSVTGNPAVPGWVILAIALLGLLASFRVEILPAAGTTRAIERNPFLDIIRLYRTEPLLFRVLLVIAYFWFAGALFQTNILYFAKNELGTGDLGSSILLTALALGTGIGRIVAGRRSEGKVEMGLVPIGSLGMCVFSLGLSAGAGEYLTALAFVTLLGLSVGFYIVPLNAFFQRRSPREVRGQYLGALNVASFSAMLLGAGFFWFVTDLLGRPASTCFVAIGVLSLAVGIVILKEIPGTFLRCVNWILSHLLYRLRVYGIKHVPRSGGALLVCNHVSFADPSLVLAALDRPVRFLMYKPIYDARIINPVARAMRAIPIHPEGGPKKIAAALQEAREAIANGELVCIFAEGALTRVGHLLPFSKGLERIMKGVDAPIIPIYLDELWGSIFSFRDGKFFWKMPKEIPYPVTMSVGKPLPAAAKTYEVRQSILELSAEAFPLRVREHQLLHAGFIDQAKRTPFRRCIADSLGQDLRYYETLAAALLLKRRVPARPQEMIGVLLPASVAGVLANLALQLSGAIPVNINHTAARDAIRSVFRRCEMKTILTSERYLEKIDFPRELFAEFGISVIDVGEKLKEPERREKICFAALALLLPASLLERFFVHRGAGRSDVATVIFSSGSTGEPKGVLLSHGNITSNLAGLYDVFQLRKEDCLLGVLPFFHSFGFTGTMWLPLLGGIRAVYHPNPMDGPVIGKLAAEHRSTILMSTPTFLLSYLRRCEPEQFKTLKHVVVGAEKLQERVAYAFEEKFGVMPLEGYGCTELSPVALLNIPDFSDLRIDPDEEAAAEAQAKRRGKIHQVGRKLGTVGHPIPGVAARVVDAESFGLIPPNEPGMLLIRGPNVMLGYLGDEDRTKEVIRDGWYVTGDIASVDEDGFVKITDRLARFSKIGGEMVPHGRVEEEIHQALGAVEQICVVVGVPDEKKGERLVVLAAVEIDGGEVGKRLAERGIPNLWIPKSFFRVESIPMLGTGKLDLKGAKELAKVLSA